MRLALDPGTEFLLPWAKRKLAQLKDELTRQGRSTGSKWVEVSTGERIYIAALRAGQQWLETIRITGGTTWICADPVQPLWSLRSAIMPATHPGPPYLAEGWGPSEEDIQHISTTYLESPRSVTRTVSGVDYKVIVNGERTVKHSLVLCRYCKRVAEYKWTEEWVFAPDTIEDPPTEPWYTITGKYNGHDTANVFLVDVQPGDAATEVNSRSLPHGLLPLALANSWGWHDSPFTAPPLPTLPVLRAWGARVVAVSSGAYGSPPTNSYVHRYEVTDQFGVVLSSVTVSGTIDSVAYPDGTLGPANGYPDITTDVSGEVPAYEGNFLLGPNPMHIWPTGHFEDYGQAGGGVRGAFAPSPTWLGVVAQADAANVASAAQYDSELDGHLNAVIAIVQGISTLLTTKLRTDATEITTDPTIPYLDQKEAYVFPAQSTTLMRATHQGSGKTKTFTLISDHAVLNTLSYSYAVGWPVLYDVEIKPEMLSPPAPYYKTLLLSPMKYSFNPTTKAFALVVPVKDAAGTDVPWMKYKKAYFTSGTDVTKPEATPVDAMPWGGMYQVKSSAAAASQFRQILGDPNSGVFRYELAISTMNRALCSGVPSFKQVSNSCYSAIFTTRGAAQRQRSDSHRGILPGYGGITVIQPAIPNTDDA